MLSCVIEKQNSLNTWLYTFVLEIHENNKCNTFYYINRNFTFRLRYSILLKLGENRTHGNFHFFIILEFYFITYYNYSGLNISTNINTRKINIESKWTIKNNVTYRWIYLFNVVDVINQFKAPCRIHQIYLIHPFKQVSYISFK